MSYRHEFWFDLTPEQLWERIQKFDRFENWWQWLTELRIEGEGLSTGTVLHGVVTPPLPYRMQLRIELTDAERPHSVNASIGGDLVGEARLQLRHDEGQTCAEVAWTIEMQQPAMRLAARFARPLLQWGHDRVVEMTVAGFRRQIERS
jgi:hypothetical protein